MQDNSMNKNTIIVAILITINLFILAIGSIEPSRKITIQQLEEKNLALQTELEETIASHEEKIQEVFIDHGNRIGELRTSIEEKDSTIKELEGKIEGNKMVDISKEDFELLYEFYFISGLYFRDDIEKGLARFPDTPYSKMVTGPPNQPARDFRYYLSIRDELSLLKLFETRVSARSPNHLRSDNSDSIYDNYYSVKISDSFPSKKDYLLEYMEEYYNIMNRFRDLEIPYSTRFISSIYNIITPTFPELDLELKRLTPRKVGIPQFVRYKEYTKIDYNEEWNKMYPDPQASYNN